MRAGSSNSSNVNEHVGEWDIPLGGAAAGYGRGAGPRARGPLVAPPRAAREGHQLAMQQQPPSRADVPAERSGCALSHAVQAISHTARVHLAVLATYVVPLRRGDRALDSSSESSTRGQACAAEETLGGI